MNSRLLIDLIVQQTTVLIAQLSTRAGARSPLAHVADQVFLTLSREIERQGVSRKVAADMFGLALRTYQRKVQRLEESGTTSGKTLWEAVLEYVTERGPLRREVVLARFKNDDERAVSAVLADLVTTGLVYSSGRGESAVYGLTSEVDRKALSNEDATEAMAILVWGAVFRAAGISTRELVRTMRVPEAETRAALSRLIADGRVTRKEDGDDAPLQAAPFVIPVGSSEGWEAAVFDHYQALANAIASKVRLRGSGGGRLNGYVGGTTLHFGIHPDHPYEKRVFELLGRMRAELAEFWNEVAEYNREHPFRDESATRVTFYFGQDVRFPADSESDEAYGWMDES